MSQDKVTATLCTKELFTCTQYKYLSPHIRQVKCEGGKDTDGEHDTIGKPAGSHTTQPDLITGSRVSD